MISILHRPDPNTQTRRRLPLGLVKRWLMAVRSHAAGIDAAHAARRQRDCLPADFSRDTGMSIEDATGLGSWQPELPFFMQSGFGTRRD